MEQRKERRQGHRSDGRFLGPLARLNCEEMPVIPAWIVRTNLEDPRKIPYLLVWRDEIGARGSSCPRQQGGEIKEAVRLTCHVDPYLGSPHRYVEIKRTDESTTALQIVWRMLPRNGGRALFLQCSYCNTPRRHVYGWEWDSFSGWSNRVRRTDWCCRSCNRLRYSSEGGYLRPAYGRLGQLGVLLRASWGNLPRPEPWLPYVFTSPEEAEEEGLCDLGAGG